MSNMENGNVVDGTVLFDKTLAIVINVEGFGGQRKVSLDNVEVDADKDRLKLASKILQCPETKAISALFHAMRASISDPRRGAALPSIFKRGTYLLPKASIVDTDAVLRGYQETLTGLVDNLRAVYYQRIAEDKLKLRDKFSESHYPAIDSLNERFCIKWRYFSLAPTAQLAEISADLYAAEVDRVTNEVNALGEEIRTALRQTAYELVAHMVDRLGVDDEGKPKVFRGSMVRNLVGFLTQFENKNIMGDTELSSILAQLKGVLEGVEPKDLRTDEALRAAVKTAVDGVIPQLETLVGSGARRVTLPDDDEATEEPEAAPAAPVVDAPAVAMCGKHKTSPKPCQKCKAEAKARREKAAA